MSEQRDKLAAHLREQFYKLPGQYMSDANAFADAILADPATHIKALIDSGVPAQTVVDALVEAGVVVRGVLGGWGQGPQWYRVLPQPEPHIHDWRWVNRGRIVCVAVDHGGDSSLSIAPVPPDAMPKYEGSVGE